LEKKFTNIHISNTFPSQGLKQMDGEYDSYSSEDDNFKKTIPKKVNSSMNMTNGKATVNQIRKSAPLLTEKISDYQKERNQKISDRFYMPFIKDKSYKLDINNKLTKIKEDSKNNAIFTNKMSKKKEEVEKIGKQLFIYNNPSNTFILLIIFNFLDININNISNITYNSIVKYIFTNHAGKDKDN